MFVLKLPYAFAASTAGYVLCGIDRPAWWFIPELGAMYHVKTPHYVLARDLQSGKAPAPSTIWRFEQGEFVPHHEPRLGAGAE